MALTEPCLLNLPPLYPITDARSDVSLSEQIRRLGAAGFPLVQFRGKPLDASAQWQELKKALAVAAENGGWPAICVNDRADLAVLAVQEGLPPWGLHLGQTDLPPSEARRLPGLAELHLGTSSHCLEEWHALDALCDHAGVGPFRATCTKGDHATPIGLVSLRAGCSILRGRGVAPIAIGGLEPADMAACFEAGAETLAMIGAIARADDPAELLWRAQLERWRVRPPVRRGQGIVLVGGSGCGKSTLARALGARLSLPVVDLDERIARHAGKSIPQLFAEAGEAAFRQLETELASSAFDAPAVVALGGGAWESEPIRRAAGASGHAVLWIAENPSRVWGRVAGDPARPLAQDRAVFMARWRARMSRWMAVPAVLPLGREAAQLAVALTPFAEG